MYKPDENDIDRLGREAAEHYHAPGNPSWDTLRKVLDKELPQEKEKKRRGFLFFFLLGIGLSLAGSAIWYGLGTTAPSVNSGNSILKNQSFTPGSKPVENTEARPLPATSNAKDQPGASAGMDAPGARHRISATAILPKPDNKIHPEPAQQAGSFSGAGPVAKHKPVFTDLSLAGATVSQRSHQVKWHKKYPPSFSPLLDKSLGKRHALAKSGSYPEKQRRQQKTFSINPDTVAGASQPDIADANEDQHRLPLDSTGANPKAVQSPLTFTDTAAGLPVAAAKKDTAKTAAVPKRRTNKDKALLFGITTGMDLSTVRYRYGSDIGYNIGLTAGYRFSKHWSVYTGIVYTKKNYKLAGADYHPPKHYWTMYVDLQTVAGYCRMWDLPLLARYTFNPGSGTILFTSAGLSSYIMKKQQYNYAFKTSTGMQGNAAWANDSTFNHVFSILDLSAGIEKRIGKHMTWQIEPYAKIPLGGVGFGNIRLSSFGVNLTIQYRQPLKR